MPWTLIGIGAGLGFVILAVDLFLKQAGFKFRAHLMPIAVGMYLPFGLATPILIGGLISHFYTRGRAEETHERALHRGVLFSSGVIAGEALTAVGLAILAAIGMKSLDLDLPEIAVSTMSIIAALLMVIAFSVLTKPKTSDPSSVGKS